MNRRRLKLLTGLRTPSAPPGLKGTALHAARAVCAEERRPSLEERLWNSSGLRLAWLATVATLLAVNLALDTSRSGPTRRNAASAPRSATVVAGDGDPLPIPAGRRGDRAAVLCELLGGCGETRPESLALVRRGDQT